MADDLAYADPIHDYNRFHSFSVSEIDAHPDAGRVWASIVEVRKSFEKTIEDYKEQIYQLKGDISELEQELSDIKEGNTLFLEGGK